MSSRLIAYPLTGRPLWGARLRGGYRDRARVLPLLTLIGLLLATLGAVEGAETRPAPDRGTAAVAFAAPRTPRATTAMTLVVVIDVSGSMEENDPSGLRHREAVEVVRWLEQYGLAGDHVGVIHFAERLKSRPPARVRLSGEQLSQALVERVDLGPEYNPFVPPLRTAARFFAANPGTTPVLMFVSDGVPDRRGDPAEIAEALRQLPRDTHLHLLGMDTGGGFSRVRDQWERVVPVRSAHAIRDIAPHSLSEPMRKVLELETGQQIQEER